MKTVTYVLSYIFTSNVFIILYGIAATSGFATREIDFHRCGDDFLAIILTYIACIVVVLLILIRCIHDCFYYTIDDTNTQVVIQPRSSRKALMILTIIVLNLWNIIVAIKSTSSDECITHYRDEHHPIIALNNVMASNAGLVGLLFIGLWFKKKCRRTPTI